MWYRGRDSRRELLKSKLGNEFELRKKNGTDSGEINSELIFWS